MLTYDPVNDGQPEPRPAQVVGAERLPHRVEVIAEAEEKVEDIVADEVQQVSDAISEQIPAEEAAIVQELAARVAASRDAP